MQKPRVLITRAAEQASALAEALRAAGCEPVAVPAIAIVAPESFAALDAAVAELGAFDWVVFTSVHGVEAFARRVGERVKSSIGGSNPPFSASLGAVRVAVIGKATARAAEAAGMRVALMPEKAVGESLAAELVEVVRRGEGRRFLLVRAEQAREMVPAALRAAGAEVTEVAGYRTVVPWESVAAVRALFAERKSWPAAVVFTSSSTAANLAALLAAAGVDLPVKVRRVSIGPVTSATLRELGWAVDAEAEEATIAGVVAAVKTV